jgi:predicted amidohydrolase
MRSKANTVAAPVQPQNRGESARSAVGRRPRLRVAAVQMTSSPDVGENLQEAGRLIATAVDRGARLVALPEYFAIMGRKEQDKVTVAEAQGRGPIQEFLAQTAKRHRIWLVAGSVPLKTRDATKVRNACLVYDDRGALAARYDKIHLFGFKMGREEYFEARTIEPGRNVRVVETALGRVGLSICYDLRFPELYRAMKAVDIILVPAAFTETTGKAHWETLLRARAIENLAYVVAPAQGGLHANGRETHGDSMIIDPWGAILDRLPRGTGVVVADIDRGYMGRMRTSLPALSHRTIARC